MSTSSFSKISRKTQINWSKELAFKTFLKSIFNQLTFFIDGQSKCWIKLETVVYFLSFKLNLVFKNCLSSFGLNSWLLKSPFSSFNLALEWIVRLTSAGLVTTQQIKKGPKRGAKGLSKLCQNTKRWSATSIRWSIISDTNRKIEHDLNMNIRHNNKTFFHKTILAACRQENNFFCQRIWKKGTVFCYTWVKHRLFEPLKGSTDQRQHISVRRSDHQTLMSTDYSTFVLACDRVQTASVSKFLLW